MKWDIRSFAQLASTQDMLKSLAAEGALEGTAVQALEQKAGRGRHGREWNSPPGNLYISILLRPDCDASGAGHISLLCAVALASAIEQVLGADGDILLKWPNDVFLAGRKCAGILLDTSISTSGELEWVVVGIGVNITNAPLGIGSFLNDHSQEALDLSAFRDKLLKNLSDLYDIWRCDGFAPICEKWVSLTYPEGAEVGVKIGTDMQKGAFAGIDENGNLLLRGEQGNMRVISAGDVYFS